MNRQRLTWNEFRSSCPHLHITFIVLALVLFLQTGCATLNCTPLENTFGGSTNLVDFSYAIADNLIDRTIPPLVPSHPDMPILVTTFVDNNDLKQTSKFGRILQEHIGSRLVQLGYTVREIKMASTLTIEPKSGETILSRDLAKISGEHQAQAILVGTVSRSERILYISARLINPVNNNILATDDYRLCMDDNILAMFRLRPMDDIDTSVREPSRSRLNSIFW
ncbi:MAG: hypothetical protein ACD_75C01647G0004 [uncultured bacterium]|nr:MAG: hypothetical protein ACD_75C01647G0004 [uncultured bacterium]